MELMQGIPYEKVLVTNSKKFSIDLLRDLLVDEKCHILTEAACIQRHALTLLGEREKADLVLNMILLQGAF